MNCPCIDCICLPACNGQNSVKSVIDKCDELAKYVAHDPTSYSRAEKAVKILKPVWYTAAWNKRRAYVRNCITNLVHHSRLNLNDGWRTNQ